MELQKLFWQAASTSVQDKFYSKMEELKVVNQEAYDYLIQRNPNSWSRAFFSVDSKCPNFENGICESFNRAILVQRTKPIITMLEDIRLYVMQRLVAMNRTARLWEDTITPSIRKRLNKMIEFQLRYYLCTYSHSFCVLTNQLFIQTGIGMLFLVVFKKLK